ncbi:hypothetical protein IV417_03710 [Alphaproteobacteria bacterium KMM 3653]|uniref:Tox-MPTase3 domain-containing protein n=1 Tax=Harenicola maris TaxID=2841044 RepID=A0AAP2CQ48_9RHOB|nr:hypothetical protein [Harenicola maris]
MRPDPNLKDRFPLLDQRLRTLGLDYIQNHKRIFDALVRVSNSDPIRVMTALRANTPPDVTFHNQPIIGKNANTNGYTFPGSPYISLAKHFCKRGERGLRKDPEGRLNVRFERTLLHELCHWLTFEWDKSDPDTIVHFEGRGQINTIEAGYHFEYYAYGGYRPWRYGRPGKGDPEDEDD